MVPIRSHIITLGLDELAPYEVLEAVEHVGVGAAGRGRAYLAQEQVAKVTVGGPKCDHGYGWLRFQGFHQPKIRGAHLGL